MCAKVVFLLVVITLAALASSSPIKEKDFDDIIFRLAEMRTELHLDGTNGTEAERHHYTVDNGEEITESDKNRLLYDYYVNPVGRYHGAKRDFDEIDRWGFDKRNFDEIDRFGFTKRSGRHPHMNKQLLQKILGQHKRNMDEIDRWGIGDFR